MQVQVPRWWRGPEKRREAHLDDPRAVMEWNEKI